MTGPRSSAAAMQKWRLNLPSSGEFGMTWMSGAKAISQTPARTLRMARPFNSACSSSAASMPGCVAPQAA